MKILTENELNNIKGGFTILHKLLFAGGLITFVIGLIDGIIRPLKCN